MENLKFWLLTLLIIGALGGLGYLAFSTIDSGSEHVNTEKINDLKKENDELKEQLLNLQTKLDKYEPQEEEIVNEPQAEDKEEVVAKPAIYKNAALIGELEQLIKDNIQMKLKSHGTRVGTVQNFLNLYNNASNKVDNDYGDSTKKAVAAFQKAVGIPSTGESGKATFQKMIDWLKQQG